MTDLSKLERLHPTHQENWGWYDGKTCGICINKTDTNTYQLFYDLTGDLYPKDEENNDLLRHYLLYPLWNEKGPIGEPIGWCDESDLGQKSITNE